jgi:SAM-dependent methyltransferase
MPDLDDYRRSSRESWDRFSANWDDERAYLAESTGGVRDRLVERLDPQPDWTVLDVAAGTGETSFAVAERLGGSGKVIATDFAPGMVEAMRRHAEELGTQNIEFRVLDAERMDIDDDSIDGVICRFGYMLMADPAAALTQTRRVLREGGRLAFAVWAAPDKNMWAAIPGMTMVGFGHLPPPEPGAPGIFALADPARITELVTAAGFSEPQIEQVPVAWGYDDPDIHWEKTLKLAAPIADAFNSLDEAGQTQVRETVAERVSEALAGDGIDGLVHIVSTS